MTKGKFAEVLVLSDKHSRLMLGAGQNLGIGAPAKRLLGRQDIVSVGPQYRDDRRGNVFVGQQVQ